MSKNVWAWSSASGSGLVIHKWNFVFHCDRLMRQSGFDAIMLPGHSG